MSKINKNIYTTKRWVSHEALAENSAKAITYAEGICLAEIDKAIHHQCVKCQDRFIYTERCFDGEKRDVIIRASATCKFVVCKHDIVIPIPSAGSRVNTPGSGFTTSPFETNSLDFEIKKEVKPKLVNKNFGTW